MPSKKHKPTRSLLSTIVLFVAVAEPLMTLPQIYQIWTTKSAAGISVLTWMGYFVAASIWLVYGLKIKDKPVIVTSALWVVTEGLVILLAIKY